MKRRSCYLFAGTLLILICVIRGGTKGSRHRHTNSTSISNSDSCETSPVRRNVTLRGGIKAGYFHKLAQYVAMELCVQLCCQEKGCDVAFMIGNNCYGVKCFSEELCHVVPANNAPRALMISKVDFRGEVYLQKFMTERLKCFQTSVEHNVTLKGGLQAGNFTAVGHVENIDACAKLCCVRDGCDLALMVNNHCFMVNCLIKERCLSTSVMNKQFRTHIARVKRTKVIAKEQQTVRALSSAPGKTSKLMCKNGIVQYNQTLLGGYDAGKFKLLSHSANISVCIRLCCGEMTCDVAFMIERKCYGVVCKTLRLCETIPAKTSTMLNHLSPKISYITSRNEEVNSVILQRQSEICKSNVISYDVTLRGGRHAGKYKAFGPVDDMEECIRVCCMQKFCDLAFVINGTCFTVRCRTEEGCQEVRSPGSGFKPMISYVVRERPRGYRKKHEKVHRKKLGKKHHQTGDLKNSKKNTTTSEMPHVPSPSLPSVDSEHYCTNSEIMYNVTLRGGITSGTFRDRGVLPNMQECLRICCIAKSCDLAFMLSNRCFSVTCKKQTLCEVVTARSSGYKPQIAYIYARSNITNHDPSSQTRSQGQSLGSLPVNEKDHPNQKPNKTMHNHTQHSSHKHKEKNRKQISPSKHKKKPYKTKKPRRRKKQKGKTHQSNRAKLKRLYAKERILLRKLSLLKLRMEMIRRKDHGGDKNTKDNVLLEAFEDDSKIPKTTLNKDKDSRHQIRHKTKGTDENTSIVSTYLVMEPSTTREATDRSEKPSNGSKPFIRKDANISMNGNIFTTKEKQSLYEKNVENNVRTENEKLFQNDTFSKERKFLRNETDDTSNIFLSFQRNETSNRPKHSTKQLVKEKEIVSNLTDFELSKFQNISFRDKVSQTQDNSQTNSKEIDDLEEREKQTKTNIENGKTSFERMKEFYSGKKDSKNNTASLEEMISQTTGSKDREFEKVLPKNRDRRENRTFGTKGKNNGNSNSQKDSAKNLANIVPNISVSSIQSEDPIETRTSPKNVSAANGLIPRSQDSFTYQQETRNDLMLLDAFSFETKENDEKPMEKHFNVPKNSSKTISSRKKGDNS